MHLETVRKKYSLKNQLNQTEYIVMGERVNWTNSLCLVSHHSMAVLCCFLLCGIILCLCYYINWEGEKWIERIKAIVQYTIYTLPLSQKAKEGMIHIHVQTKWQNKWERERERYGVRQEAIEIEITTTAPKYK